MKKIISILAFTVLPTVAYSQLPLVEYKPVIVGNSIDRIWRGEVVDFLDFNLGFYRWPTFNIADSAICVGVILFLLSSLLRKAPSTQHSGKEPSEK